MDKVKYYLKIDDICSEDENKLVDSVKSVSLGIGILDNRLCIKSHFFGLSMIQPPSHIFSPGALPPVPWDEDRARKAKINDHRELLPSATNHSRRGPEGGEPSAETVIKKDFYKAKFSNPFETDMQMIKTSS